MACRLTAAAVRAGRGRLLLPAVQPGGWCRRRHGRGGRAAAGLAAAAARQGGDGSPAAWRLVGEFGFETEEKKSRFLALASPVSSSEEAMAWVSARSDLSASHNCWAYRVGPRGDEYRFTDDGEPGGTAGQPILRAIEGKEVVDVAVLVIRYYGGVKLGAGGLTRAYGGAASKCLDNAPKDKVVAMAEVGVEVGFDHIGKLYGLIGKFGAEKGEEIYGTTSVKLQVMLEEAALDGFRAELLDVTGGQARVTV